MTAQGQLEGNALWLHERRAWRWQWPDEKNRWDTKKKRKRGPSQPYHGPSDRVLARRFRRGREGHNYRRAIGVV